MEMLIVLAIIAILTSVSWPMLRHGVDQSDAMLLQSQLRQAIQQGKAWARIYQAPVALCKSADQQSCVGDWAAGWLIFRDENKDGMIQNQNQILGGMQHDANRGMLHWRSFPAYRDSLLFLPTGLMSSDNGTFWYCTSRTMSPWWALVINRSGRVRVVYPDKKGHIQDDRGSLLMC